MRNSAGSLRVPMATGDRDSSPLPLLFCIVVVVLASAVIYALLFSGVTLVSQLF